MTAFIEPAYIEIVEKYRGNEPIALVPNEVRINGQPLCVSAEHPIKVHEIALAGEDLVVVTLTLIARRVEIKAEPEEGTE